MTDVDITVVVPTLDRPDDLARCLDGVAAQRFAPAEIVVVIQAHDDASRAVADRYGARVAVVDKPGLAAAIEQGIAAARTGVVAFIDDDAVPRAGWVARIAGAYAEDPRLGFLGGRDNVDGDADAGAASLPVGLLRRGTLHGNHHLGKGPMRPADHVKGANMSFRTRAVRGLPLGDLVAGGGAQAGNELFLSFCAKRRGYEGAYDPAVVVDHYPATRAQGDERDRFSRERTRLDTRNALAAIRAFLPWWQGALYATRMVVIGHRKHPGMVVAVLNRLQRVPDGGYLSANLRGVADGWRDGGRIRRDVARTAAPAAAHA
ncbi:glycosyltransferase family 2 protein [Demequina subtropica]|uniref:glycosyltransferase family 2 protein n=1 Tax=Demequina subtropica TaxID=1638989 RepID=UPI0007846B07|nr:glycosyltransferase family 2 protein [Demequina subtropica]